jgi:hypothetical protein
VDKTVSRISDSVIGTDAYSGATVSALNRVPIWLSQSKKTLQDLQLSYILFKERFCQSSISPRSGLQEKNKNFLTDIASDK